MSGAGGMFAGTDMDFDSLSMSQEEACDVIYKMLIEVGTVEEFKTTEEVVRRFANRIPESYNHVPFHCFQHAVMVTQMTFLIITRCDMEKFVGRQKCITLMIAALCHDMQHPGLSNDYLIRTGHEYAQKHASSPLEHHHLSVANSLVKDGLTANLTTAQHDSLLEDIQGFILATDLAHHGGFMKAGKEIAGEFKTSNPEHVQMMCKLALKCADVSNECRPHAIALRWLHRLNDEVWAQGDQEKSAGVTPKAMMDREQADLNKQQIGFIEFLLMPMYSCLADILPGFSELTSPAVQAALQGYKDAAAAEQQQ